MGNGLLFDKKNLYLTSEIFQFEFLTNTFLTVQQLDSVSSSHEIAIDVNNPDEINEIFDDITYSKGGSVIRMANYFIGNDTFYKGVKVKSDYLFDNSLIVIFFILKRDI